MQYLKINNHVCVFLWFDWYEYNYITISKLATQHSYLHYNCVHKKPRFTVLVLKLWQKKSNINWIYKINCQNNERNEDTKKKSKIKQWVEGFLTHLLLSTNCQLFFGTGFVEIRRITHNQKRKQRQRRCLSVTYKVVMLNTKLRARILIYTALTSLFLLY